MKSAKTWQMIAERISESGWSWRHVTLPNRTKRAVHIVEAHNDDGGTHAAVANSIRPAFVALERSINAAGK